MSEDEGGKTNRSEAPAMPQLENDDLLADSLRRVPALPSSLLRASLVCKRWCRVVSDPIFLREFRAHHRKPPLLGFFSRDRGLSGGVVEFTPMLDPPDQIPASRFSLQVTRGSKVLRCHHGRVLIHSPEEQHLLVWDPVTGDLRHLALPPALCGGKVVLFDGEVVCTSTGQGHVHGACHSDPFQVVVVAGDSGRFYGCVYSSETRAWGNLVSLLREPPGGLIPSPTCPSSMFRNSICLLLIGRKPLILEFDWAKKNLAIIDVPLDAHDFLAIFCGRYQVLITRGDSGGLSFIVLAGLSVHVWNRTSHVDGVATWILGNTIKLHNSAPLRSAVGQEHLFILGLDEDDNVLFKLTDSETVLMVHLESMKFKKLPQKMPYIFCTPFSSFYTPGIHVNNTGRDAEAQIFDRA